MVWRAKLTDEQQLKAPTEFAPNNQLSSRSAGALTRPSLASPFRYHPRPSTESPRPATLGLESLELGLGTEPLNSSAASSITSAPPAAVLPQRPLRVQLPPGPLRLPRWLLLSNGQDPAESFSVRPLAPLGFVSS